MRIRPGRRFAIDYGDFSGREGHGQSSANALNLAAPRPNAPRSSGRLLVSVVLRGIDHHDRCSITAPFALPNCHPGPSEPNASLPQVPVVILYYAKRNSIVIGGGQEHNEPSITRGETGITEGWSRPRKDPGV
jgi:hypothetical protein